MYWSLALVALVAVGEVTVTSTVPAAWAGAVAVIWPPLSTVNVVAGVAPKFTAVTSLRYVPAIVTLVPPAVLPDDGVTEVTAGTQMSGGRHRGEEVVVGPPAPTTVAEIPSVCGSACGMPHCVAASPGPTSVAVTVTAGV